MVEEVTRLGGVRTPETVKRDQKVRTARRRANKAESSKVKALEALEIAYKPVAEWDAEELARGKPRDKTGHFRGPKPDWVTRQVHEEAHKRFIEWSQTQMQVLVPEAVKVVRMLMTSDERDKRGKPIVAASTKLDAAKWVVEHLVGKPTQRVEADISVRLQSLLANVLVQPEEAESAGLISSVGTQKVLELEAVEDEDEE